MNAHEEYSTHHIRVVGIPIPSLKLPPPAWAVRHHCLRVPDIPGSPIVVGGWLDERLLRLFPPAHRVLATVQSKERKGSRGRKDPRETKAKRNARHKVAGPNEIHKRRPSEDHVVVPIAGEVLDSRAGAEPLSCWHGREPCAVAQDVLPCCPGAVGRGAVSV